LLLGKWPDISETLRKQLTNHNTLVEATNQSTLCSSERGASYRQEVNSVTHRLGRVALQ